MSKLAKSSQGGDPARWRDRPYPGRDSAQVQKAIGFIGARQDFFVEGIARWIRDFLARHALSPEDLLDLGCGVGLIHPYLNGVANRIHGMDISADAIETARRANAEVDYALYDGLNLPSPAESYDVVLAITVMHHVPVKQWRSFVAESRRVLRPGGVFIVIEHNPFNPLTRYSVRQCPFDEDAILLRAGKVIGLMRAVGLENCGRDYLFFAPFTSDSLQSVERRLTWLPLGAQYAAWGFKR